MALNSERPDLTLGVVGVGIMGQGIAQIAAQAGINVRLYDAKPDAAQDARAAVQAQLERLVEKGKLGREAAAEAIALLQPVGALEDLAPCHLVVEAIVEKLEVKRQLFQSLEAVVSEDCLLATNTSSLSVTAIAAGCRRPGRFGGLHFFNPVPVMKIVEVIDGLLTEDWVSEALTVLARRMGHTPVRAQDTPGFIVNHGGRGFGTEALRILGEDIAEFYEIDRILCEAAGFRIGPFGLLDLTGLDVSHPVMESIYNQYYQEPRYRPSPITRQRVEAGLLGRKTGRGFYTYRDGAAEPMPAMPLPEARPARVWVSRADPQAHAAVAELVGRLGGVADTGEKPAADALCVVTPLGQDATTAALSEGLDATRVIALDTLVELSRRRTLMTTPVTAPLMRKAAHGLFGADGVPVSVVHDSPGFVAQRVLATIINIGCDMAQQRIASPEDIDRAIALGLGYPYGPLAWGDALGPLKILTILDNMHAFYGDPRYRPSPWLTRRARLGVSLLTLEA